MWASRSVIRRRCCSADSHSARIASLNRTCDGGSEGPSSRSFSSARASCRSSSSGSRTRSSSVGTPAASGVSTVAARTVGNASRKAVSLSPEVLATAYGLPLAM